MEEADRLRKLAAECRRIAAATHTKHTAETLQDMAREFEASAAVSERLPLLSAHPIRRKRRSA